MIEADALHDVVFITLPDTLQRDFEDFIFNPTIPLPVQLADGSSSIHPSEGISIEMIAAGLIKIVAHAPSHTHAAYYRSLLIALQPDIVKELQIAAIARAKVEDYDFAEELFSAANFLSPEIPELFVNLSVLYGQKARVAIDKDDQESADIAIENQVNVLRRGLEHHPNSELLLAEFGMLHLFLGNDEIALTHLTKYLNIADTSEKRDLIEKRVKEINERLENDQTLHAAFDEMQLGNEEQALRLIETFISNNKDVWSGWFIKGWAHRRLTDYAAAQEAFLKCLELGEQNADIYNELSICSLELGNEELAKNYLEIALELDNDNVKLLSNLAFLHIRDEEFNQAHDLLLRAQEIDPKDPAIIHLQKELGIEEDSDVIHG